MFLHKNQFLSLFFCSFIHNLCYGNQERLLSGNLLGMFSVNFMGYFLVHVFYFHYGFHEVLVLSKVRFFRSKDSSSRSQKSSGFVFKI